MPRRPCFASCFGWLVAAMGSPLGYLQLGAGLATGFLAGFLLGLFSGRTRRALENVWDNAWDAGYETGHTLGALTVIERRASVTELKPRLVKS